MKVPLLTRIWSVMASENSADHILTNKDAKGQGDLLGNPRTTPRGITLLHLHNGTDEFGAWPFRSRLGPALRRKQQSVFSLLNIDGTEAVSMASR